MEESTSWVPLRCWILSTWKCRPMRAWRRRWRRRTGSSAWIRRSTRGTWRILWETRWPASTTTPPLFPWSISTRISASPAPALPWSQNITRFPAMYRTRIRPLRCSTDWKWTPSSSPEAWRTSISRCSPSCSPTVTRRSCPIWRETTWNFPIWKPTVRRSKI